MKITIGEKEYTLYFGLDFIEQLDKLEKVEVNGMTVEVGTTKYIGFLADSRNPKYLVEIIKAATNTDEAPPEVKDIRKWIEDQPNIKDTVDAFLLRMSKVSLLAEMVAWKQMKISNKTAEKMYI